MAENSPAPWDEATCRVPMWMGGFQAGFCGARAYGHQYPRRYLSMLDGRYLFDRPAYCFGHCCPNHGGPSETGVRLFVDGHTSGGRPMWCAVLPGFVNLQESTAEFDPDPVEAARKILKGAKP